MRVAFNIGCLYRPDGVPVMRSGIAYYMDGLLKALFDLNTAHEFRAFAPIGSWKTMHDMASEDAFAWWTEQRHRERVDVAGNAGPLPPEPSETLPRLRFRARRKWSLVAAQRGARRYDLMHLPSPTYFSPARYAPRCNVATIYDMTVRTHAWGHAPENIQTWEDFFTFTQTRCQRILTISEVAKESIIEHLRVAPERVVVTPLAPRSFTRATPPGPERDALLRECGLEPGQPFVLYAGTIEPRKNCDRLLRGFAAALGETPSLRDYKIVLAGGVWMGLDEKMREIAAEEGIAENLIQTGYVSSDQMNALMSSCTAFAYVSLSEGFGLPPLEAMTCGAPVVTSNISSMPEVVGYAGITVDPVQVESIAAGLHRLLTDEAENRRQRELSRQRAAEFTWTHTAKLTIQAYEEALQEAASAKQTGRLLSKRTGAQG